MREGGETGRLQVEEAKPEVLQRGEESETVGRRKTLDVLKVKLCQPVAKETSGEREGEGGAQGSGETPKA